MIRLFVELDHFGARSAIKIDLDERKFSTINTCSDDLAFAASFSNEVPKNSDVHINKIIERKKYVDYLSREIANKLISLIENQETHNGYKVASGRSCVN